MRRILLLDDEPNVLRALRQQMPNAELIIETFTDPEAALLRFADVSFDIAISDFRMPGIDGIQFLSTVKRMQPDAVRLLLSASNDFDTLVHAINQAEVFRYVAKPWQAEELKKTLELAFASRDQQLEAQRPMQAPPAAPPLSPQELEARRLEAEEPGITQVHWEPDGSLRLD